MLWMLSLHIAALLFWSAGLLYVTAVMAGNQRELPSIPEPLPGPHASLERFVFTHIATPAALLAIIAGTLVFLINNTVAVWLLVKLTLVSALAVCHVLVGILIIWDEAEEHRPVRLLSVLFAVAISLLLIIVLWVVLAKPDLEVLPWTL